jgi:hypothetical protein
LDAEGERLDAALFECATDFSKATALGEERANVDQKLEALYAEWEDLESVSPPDA